MAVNWGQESITGFDYIVNWTAAMGGTVLNLDNMTLQSVSVYCGSQHDSQIRVAVYQGGTTSLPTDAALIEDFGKTSGTGTYQFLKLTSVSNPSLTKNEPTWIVFRGSSASGNFRARATTSYPIGSDFYSAYGRVYLASMGNDPDASFPSVLPSGGTTADYWYDMYITILVVSTGAIKDLSINNYHGNAVNSPIYAESKLKLWR